MDFLFADNSELDNLDTVPVEFKPFYAQEQGGKFKVSEAFIPTTVTFDGLRKNFKSAQENLTRANGESATRRISLEAWTAKAGVASPDELGVKLDQLTKDLSEGKKINPDTIRTELQAQFQTQVDTAKAETLAMESSLKEYMLDGQALTAIAEHKGNPTLLMPHIRSQSAVIKDPTTGKYRAVAVNDRGEPLPDTDGGWLSVTKLVERLKANKDYAPCFTVTPASGGGTPPGNQRTFTPAGGPREHSGGGDNERSPRDKIAAGLAKRSGVRVGA